MSVSYFCRILRLRFQQHRDQRVEARPQPGDLARIEPDRPGQFLVGQFAQAAVGQHVLERRRDQSGGGCVGLGKFFGSYFW